MWYFSPHTIREGGPLVSVLFALSIMLFAYIVERTITLRKARGAASIQSFFRKVVQMMQTGDLDGVLAACDKQQGSLANVIRAGVDRYSQVIKDPSISGEKRVAETQRAIEEANALEIPLLERNLIALSTIASIATMVGLLGTTIGMIRAFAATGSSQGGVIDANALAQGISEALINTAGGLFNAIVGIVGYNFFVNKVDAFNYTIDEATYEVLQLIKSKESA
jgi:biopolymer transport protein ExbB